MCLVIEELLTSIRKKAHAPRGGLAKVAISASIVPILAIATYQAFVSTNPKILDQANTLTKKEPDGLVSRALVPNVSIQSDGRFRGSVAMLACIPGGQIMRKAGIPDDAPFTKENIQFSVKYLRTYDPMLFMTGL
jgi:hypothetical protein